MAASRRLQFPVPTSTDCWLKVSGCILSGVPTPAAPLVPEPYLKSLFVVLMSFGVFLLELIS